MNMSALKKLLIFANVLLLCALAGVITWVFRDIKRFQSEEHMLLLDKPAKVEIEIDTGVGIEFFRSISTLEIGPRKEVIKVDPEEVIEVDWEDGFLAKWRLKTQPWALSDPTKRWALLEDSDGTTTRKIRMVPAGVTFAKAKQVKDQKTTDDPEIALELAEMCLLPDESGQKWALVSDISKDGVEITNDKGEQALIMYVKENPWEILAKKGEDKGGIPSGRKMPKATRPIAANTWEIGEPDQVDWSENYATYLDEVNLRAWYDPRTRKLQGLQIRSKVPTPKFTKFGLRNRDVITKVNGVEVTSASQVNDLIANNRTAEKLVVEILRQSKTMTLTYNLTAAEDPKGGAAAPGNPRQPAKRR